MSSDRKVVAEFRCNGGDGKCRRRVGFIERAGGYGEDVTVYSTYRSSRREIPHSLLIGDSDLPTWRCPNRRHDYVYLIDDLPWETILARARRNIGRPQVYLVQPLGPLPRDLADYIDINSYEVERDFELPDPDEVDRWWRRNF